MTDSEIIEATRPWRERAAMITIESGDYEKINVAVWAWISIEMYKAGRANFEFSQFIAMLLREDGWRGSDLIERLPQLGPILSPKARTLTAVYATIEQEISRQRSLAKSRRWPGIVKE